MLLTVVTIVDAVVVAAAVVDVVVPVVVVEGEVRVSFVPISSTEMSQTDQLEQRCASQHHHILA